MIVTFHKPDWVDMRTSLLKLLWISLFTVSASWAQHPIKPDTITVYKLFSPVPHQRRTYVPSVEVGRFTMFSPPGTIRTPAPLIGPMATPSTIVYPDLAVRAVVEGMVIVKLRIDSLGVPTRLETMWSDEIFRGVVEEAVSKSTFRPATSAGWPIAVDGFVVFRFSLSNQTQSLDSLRVASEIKLNRTMGMTGGPTYEVTLRKDGTASYKGYGQTPRIGTYQGACRRSDFERLERLLGWLSFFNESIPTYCMGEMGCEMITVVSDGKSFFKDADGTDERIWALAHVIDQIAESIEWNELR